MLSYIGKHGLSHRVGYQSNECLILVIIIALDEGTKSEAFGFMKCFIVGIHALGLLFLG
jgi:hypothetical protein